MNIVCPSLKYLKYLYKSQVKLWFSKCHPCSPDMLERLEIFWWGERKGVIAPGNQCAAASIRINGSGWGEMER